MTLEQNLYNGSRAREVLDNEQFQEAFEAIEKELIDAWKQSPQRDQEGRERIHQYLSLLQKVKSHLVSTMETGKLAELEVRHKQTLLERAREWVA
jgi:predicted SnoaL-like aldol condensation-catalyzing enzyme